MGRTKEFEGEAALEKAMKVFWEKGYEHSSLKDLLDAMEIQNGSFYHTFGSKKNLFMKSLELYYADLSRKRAGIFESQGCFKDHIRALFSYSLNRQKKKNVPKGCFIINSLSSDTLENEDIRRFVLGCIGDFESYLAKQIRHAIDSGELEADLDADRTAAVVNIYLQGLLKLCVLNFSEAQFKAQTEFFLRSLKI